MAFNISQFKSEMDRRGGPARSSLFEVIIAGIDNDATTEESDRINSRTFSFFCSSATIPGINFDTTPLNQVGQLAKVFPTSVTNEPINTVFMVDSDHEILNYFHKWMQKIVNHGSGGGKYNAINGNQLPYEIGYKREYSTTVVIRHYSTESDNYPFDKYYEIQLSNAFPVAMGDLDLAWESNDSFLTLPISFAYDNISFDGTLTGTPSGGRNSRGNGLLDALGDFASFGSVVNQTFKDGLKFESVQDAINKLQRVRNSMDNISNKY